MTGFDDIPITRYLRPPLTTVHVGVTELGRLALERLADRLERDAPVAPADRLDCAVMVRGSCRAALTTTSPA
ncbi:substrate-binding domain-containing protein [Frateuria terrea]|uniref:substrate-binding domain-containing protein n=1 Tax=Frateuria terrea TaxID=529704 RepID=UPI001FE00B5E